MVRTGISFTSFPIHYENSQLGTADWELVGSDPSWAFMAQPDDRNASIRPVAILLSMDVPSLQATTPELDTR